MKAIVGDVVGARKEARTLKLLSTVLLVSAIMLLGSMFAAAYLAQPLSKEVHHLQHVSRGRAPLHPTSSRISGASQQVYQKSTLGRVARDSGEVFAVALANSTTTLPLRVVEANLGDSSMAEDFLRRSVTHYGDLRALGSALGRARATGSKFNVAVVGGSTSNGGGYAQCRKKASKACGQACCGRGYLAELRLLLGRTGIDARVINRARGGTGPDLVTVCMSSIFGNTVNMSAIDVFVVEYAINTSPVCAGDGFSAVVAKADRLLWRIRANAPQAAVVLMHTFALDRFVDASPCYDLLAQRYALPSVSLRTGLWPLLASGQLQPIDVLQPMSFHHPNVRGHQLMGCALLSLLLEAELRFGLSPAPPWAVIRDPAEQELSANALFNAELHREMLSPAATRCAAVQSGTVDAMIVNNTGWRLDSAKQRYMYASAPGAELSLRVACESAAGCALSVGLSQSYQPLGIIEIRVDGAFVTKVNEASKALRDANDFITVEHFINVLPFVLQPAAHGSAVKLRGELPQGEHTVSLHATGESAEWTSSWWSNYSLHEVHFRSIAVITMVKDCLGRGCNRDDVILKSRRTSRLQARQHQSSTPAADADHPMTRRTR